MSHPLEKMGCPVMERPAPAPLASCAPSWSSSADPAPKACVGVAASGSEEDAAARLARRA